MCTLNIGADVAKDEIIVACSESTFAPHALCNRRRDLQTWLKSLPTGTRLALESTGRYHDLLARLAQATGIAVFVITLRDLRHYAKAVGARAKTDRMDA